MTYQTSTKTKVEVTSNTINKNLVSQLQSSAQEYQTHTNSPKQVSQTIQVRHIVKILNLHQHDTRAEYM